MCLSFISVYDYTDEFCQSNSSSGTYQGKVSVTNNNNTCQRWDQQAPHKHNDTANSDFIDGSATAAENYCRGIKGKDDDFF